MSARKILSLLGAAGALALMATQADAHARVVASTPAASATVASPSAITVTFSEPGRPRLLRAQCRQRGRHSLCGFDDRVRGRQDRLGSDRSPLGGGRLYRQLARRFRRRPPHDRRHRLHGALSPNARRLGHPSPPRAIRRRGRPVGSAPLPALRTARGEWANSRMAEATFDFRLRHGRRERRRGPGRPDGRDGGIDLRRPETFLARLHDHGDKSGASVSDPKRGRRPRPRGADFRQAFSSGLDPGQPGRTSRQRQFRLDGSRRGD